MPLKTLRDAERLQEQRKAKELKDSLERILLWFFSFPDQGVSVNELVEQVGISKSTAQEIIPQLVESGFLHKEVFGRMHRLRCNTEHIFNLSRKIGHNLRTIYESGLIRLIEQQIPQAKNMILFGSYRTGQDTERSDIDIAVEVPDDIELQIVPVATIATVGYRKDVQVNLHVFCRNRIGVNLFNSIANGIVLKGFLEVRT